MRISEAIYILNEKILPTPREFREIFTHISREDAIKLRKNLKVTNRLLTVGSSLKAI